MGKRINVPVNDRDDSLETFIPLYLRIELLFSLCSENRFFIAKNLCSEKHRPLGQ